MDGGQRSAIRGARLFDGERLTEGPVLVLVDHGRITDVDFTGAAPPWARRASTWGMSPSCRASWMRIPT